MKDIFVNGLCSISPQETYEKNSFLDNPINYKQEYLKVINPDYKNFIDNQVLRRMSNIIRMGVTSAKIAMQEAEIESLDAIIAGTGLGCMTDTEKFLNRLIDNNETLLTPTSFIQSTHNTVAAQIAVMINCKKYNMTYVNQNIAFELALTDAIITINEGVAENILVGGIDEITTENFEQKKRISAWKTSEIDNFNLLNSKTEGCLAGECSTFAVLSTQKTENTYAKIIDVFTIFKASENELQDKLLNFLQKYNLNFNDIDVVITGNNGNFSSDKIYDEFCSTNFPNSTQLVYKHLVGEHDSASSFGFWIAAKILKNNIIPKSLVYKNNIERSIKYVLIYNFNYYFKYNHSFVLMQKA